MHGSGGSRILGSKYNEAGVSPRNETLTAHEFVVDFLRKELVGPAPGYPAIQLNGEEILRAQDPPRHRYGAGILFPSRIQLENLEATVEDEENLEDSDALNEIPWTGQDIKNSDYTGEEVSRTEVQPETDSDVTLANEFLPSAMGLSALIEMPERLTVDVSAGIYTRKELQGKEEPASVTGKSSNKAWWRKPVTRSIDLFSEELLSSSTTTIEKTVFEKDGKACLSLNVVSRPYAQEDAKHKRVRLVTFTIVNRRRSNSRNLVNSDLFFQCGFSVRDPKGQTCFLGYPEQSRDEEDLEALSLKLLFLHRKTFAVGHGCAPEWSETADGRADLIRTEVLPTYEVKPVLPTQIEGLNLNMAELAKEGTEAISILCNKLADEYEDWILARESEIDSRPELTPKLKETGYRHMADCRQCLGRMRDGIGLLGGDGEVELAFRLMNEAMHMQSVHYTIASEGIRNWVKTQNGYQLEKPFVKPCYSERQGKRNWHPFQLAFILMNLKAIAIPTCSERVVVDVIWFPTGGGKTEAYLGLSAFSMFLRRIRNPTHAGTCILMRYTLRLLTTQQFQRAASLICACEVIRQRMESQLGAERFTIGLWVGSEVSPNTEDDAIRTLRELNSGRGVNKFIMLSCPWCGAAMGPQQVEKHTICKGYRKLSHPNRIRHRCEDPDCEFNSGEGLPLAVIDEHIYQSPPTLLLGTVDKLAMLTFQPKARSLFGINNLYPPPDLIIQDELHLISGPLGSMVGHYETAVDALCTQEIDGTLIRAKVIASTATISRAASQVKGLYGRSAFLFPPQALKAGDSFFAEEREDERGRFYVGVFATALHSHVAAQVKVMGALLQAPKFLDARDSSAIDSYWTMMGYFNSLRELGYAATLVRAEIREFINGLCDRLGLLHTMGKMKGPEWRRFINQYVELTSRIQSNQIPSILKQLFTPYEGTADVDTVDVCFATNMIQVGLDIPRLGLMTIVGQPKTTSEYIQASSRIGRNITNPGIVVINYNPFKPRDRSHYEHFRSYHHSIYRHVEPSSMTAFSTPVRERALHALVVILCRFWGCSDLRESPRQPPSPDLVQKIKATIQERVLSVDPTEWPNTEKDFDEIISQWKNAPRSLYGGFELPTEELPLLHPAGRQRHPQWPEGLIFDTPSSMRHVDIDCSARALEGGYGD